MLENNRVIVFPDGIECADGIPELKIIDQNLKNLTGCGPIQKKTQSLDKYKRKGAKTDSRLPPAKDGQEAMAKAGGTFDPRMFKGNCMLFNHLNEASLSKTKKIPEMSGSYKLKKNARVREKPTSQEEEEEYKYFLAYQERIKAKIQKGLSDIMDSPPKKKTED